ncbi:hypothetical protein JTE90_010651 [Oedothorax gibbosus]|uniref:CCHC-type domain-containing protein n=1 Tax=Oedothorax gibbosus TaxID=931172 RepID=A0AAV6TLK8_9ARAC|nr:hypothetical protein JTE90_010651 [Oedothorax gibbosus]
MSDVIPDFRDLYKLCYDLRDLADYLATIAHRSWSTLLLLGRLPRWREYDELLVNNDDFSLEHTAVAADDLLSKVCSTIDPILPLASDLLLSLSSRVPAPETAASLESALPSLRELYPPLEKLWTEYSIVLNVIDELPLTASDVADDFRTYIDSPFGDSLYHARGSDERCPVILGTGELFLRSRELEDLLLKIIDLSTLASAAPPPLSTLCDVAVETDHPPVLPQDDHPALLAPPVVAPPSDASHASSPGSLAPLVQDLPRLADIFAGLFELRDMTRSLSREAHRAGDLLIYVFPLLPCWKTIEDLHLPADSLCLEPTTVAIDDLVAGTTDVVFSIASLVADTHHAIWTRSGNPSAAAALETCIPALLSLSGQLEQAEAEYLSFLDAINSLPPDAHDAVEMLRELIDGDFHLGFYLNEARGPGTFDPDSSADFGCGLFMQAIRGVEDCLLTTLELHSASSLLPGVPPLVPPATSDAAVGEDAPLPTTCSIAVGDDFQALWTPPALCDAASGDDSPPPVTASSATNTDPLCAETRVDSIASALARIILLVDDSERGLQSLASRAKAAADALEISPVSPISPPLNATDDSSPRPRHSWSSRDSGRGSSAPPSLHDELSASGTSHFLSSTINSRRSSRSSLKRVSFGSDVVIHEPPSPPGPPPPVHSARQRVIVFGLSELSSASSICDALLGLPSCPPGPLDVVRFFYGRDGSRNCILSADSLICDFLDGFPRISIDHLRVRVRRFIFIGRCFNCHHLDHLAKDCSLPPACGICGGTHRSSGCCDPPRCLLCPSNNAHRSDSPTCPTLLAYKKSKLAAHVRSTSLRQGPPSPPVRRPVSPSAPAAGPVDPFL